MAVTNLFFARTLDGKGLRAEDIKPGLLITLPASTGGRLEYICESLDEHQAAFKSTDKNWPYTCIMKFNQPEFTMEDFERANMIMKGRNCIPIEATQEDRDHLHRAHELGHIMITSYTQAAWTDRGYETYLEMKRELEARSKPSSSMGM